MSTTGIVRSEPDLSGSLHPFRERLAETVAWCQRRAALGNLPDSLRSAPLAPPPATSWPASLRAVADNRLQQLGRSWRRSQDALGGGLLLLYFPAPPSSEGSTGIASAGYFDVRDTPPWDTWVAFVEERMRSYLVAWVPPEAQPFVTAAMQNGGASLRWLNASGVELEEQLNARKAG
jgi:hypothetical protein